MSELPFIPFSEPLREIIRRKHITPVAKWLVGPNPDVVTAQQSGSIWESALTVTVLAQIRDVLQERGEEEVLCAAIAEKSAAAAKWILAQRRVVTRESGQHCCWEDVTWDTAVVIRAVLLAMQKYPDRFDGKERKDAFLLVSQALEWLSHCFLAWETETKYPFGPADVAQIALTIIFVQTHYPALIVDLESRSGSRSYDDLLAEIARYLMHIRTEESLRDEKGARVPRNQRSNTCWWDDYFNTAEVVEALATYYSYCSSDAKRAKLHAQTLAKIRAVLLKACAFFERGQVDATWGSHIDTIKVITAYVMIRRLIPQTSDEYDEPLIVPEIHTTFKALRWICDKKQIFSDGSFMHTMFLTIFYSLAMVEVYTSWQPARRSVGELYDDVVWFSPVRTTPERSKRLALALRHGILRSELAITRSRHVFWRRMFTTLAASAIAVLLFLALGSSSGILDATVTIFVPATLRNQNIGDFYQFLSVGIALYLGLLALIWKWKS